MALSGIAVECSEAATLVVEVVDVVADVEASVVDIDSSVAGQWELCFEEHTSLPVLSDGCNRRLQIPDCLSMPKSSCLGCSEASPAYPSAEVSHKFGA